MVRSELSPTSTYPLLPSKLNAWPTMPLAYPAPPCSVPLLVPTLSKAFPSAFHQATILDKGAIRVTFTTAEVVVRPLLSVAQAVSAQAPAGGFVQTRSNGELV